MIIPSIYSETFLQISATRDFERVRVSNDRKYHRKFGKLKAVFSDCIPRLFERFVPYTGDLHDTVIDRLFVDVRMSIVYRSRKNL